MIKCIDHLRLYQSSSWALLGTQPAMNQESSKEYWPLGSAIVSCSGGVFVLRPVNCLSMSLDINRWPNVHFICQKEHLQTKQKTCFIPSIREGSGFRQKFLKAILGDVGQSNQTQPSSRPAISQAWNIHRFCRSVRKCWVPTWNPRVLLVLPHPNKLFGFVWK